MNVSSKVSMEFQVNKKSTHIVYAVIYSVLQLKRILNIPLPTETHFAVLKMQGVLRMGLGRL